MAQSGGMLNFGTDYLLVRKAKSIRSHFGPSQYVPNSLIEALIPVFLVRRWPRLWNSLRMSSSALSSGTYMISHTA